MPAVCRRCAGRADCIVKIMRTLYGNAYREITKYRMGGKHFLRYGQAERLLIKEVAPTAHRLAQHKARSNYIRKCKEANFSDLCEYERRKQAAYHGAVYGKAAAPHIQYCYGILQIAVQLKKNVIEPRSHNARGDYNEAHVYNSVLFKLFAFFLAVRYAYGNYHGNGHYYAVPVYVLSKKGERHPIRHAHQKIPSYDD